MTLAPFALQAVLLVGFLGPGLPTIAQGPSLVPTPHNMRLKTFDNVLAGPAEEQASARQLTIRCHHPNDPRWRAHLAVFAGTMQRLTASEVMLLPELDARGAALTVSHNADYQDEEYSVQFRDGFGRIETASLQGLAHATATLLQIAGQQQTIGADEVHIREKPTCSYRSVMVDLGRNPHSVSVLKETVDLLWFYKMDSLHLHLTDDQHFAFPSKAFPKLPTKRCAISWEQFAKLERYASIRGISLIPELDVPGHSAILRKEYPDVFGKTATDVARLPSSRAAIKTLLDEMIELFPSSPFVHVGGDEAYGVPEQRQRELINELHAHLKQQGKQTLVWEGPALGTGKNKVDPEVIHINWRTINFPADQMLKAGYRVVNAAWDPLYVVDHYPRNNFTMASPEHIFTSLDRYRFKHFNPGISTFALPINVKPTEQVIGFCMPWWEGREHNYRTMMFPRVIPMAEIAWNPNRSRDFDDFQKRIAIAERSTAPMFLSSRDSRRSVGDRVRRRLSQPNVRRIAGGR